MSAAKPAPHVTATAVGAVARAFLSRLSPGARREIQKLNVDLENVRATTPLADWNALLLVITRELHGQLPWQEGVGLTAAGVVNGYVETTIGKAVFSVARLVGIRRSMDRMVQSFETSTNYLCGSLRELKPTEVEVTMAYAPDFQSQGPGLDAVGPHYRLGLLRSGLHVLGAKEYAVNLLEVGDGEKPTRYHLRWQAAR